MEYCVMKRMAVTMLCLIFLSFCSPSVFSQKEKEKSKQEPQQKKRKPSFTISKETTHLTGPLDKDGRIDYATALNERLREGVTPANNANGLLWQAFGPQPEQATISPQYFEWMKIPAPPVKGDYFLNVHRFLKDHLKVKPEVHADQFHEEISRTTARPWDPKDSPQIAEWLKVNEKPLTVVVEASKRTYYFSPLVPVQRNGKSTGLFTAPVPAAPPCRGAANALTARAMLKLGQGRPDDAWQDLLACHRLARHVARGPTLIDELVGVAIEWIACKADLAFIERATLDAKQLKSCLRDLQALPPMPMLADKLDLAQRYSFLDLVMILDREGIDYLETLSSSGLVIEDGQDRWAKLFTKLAFSDIQWDPALRNFNQFFDRMSSAMRLKNRDLREKQLTNITIDIRALKTSLVEGGHLVKSILGAKNLGEVKGKYLGDLMICMLSPAVVKVQEAADRTEQIQHNLHLAFALAAYRIDNDRFPRKLDALAPKYLPTVPKDLFSGKALIYRPSADGYLLYSVGVNGRDDDGRSYDDDPPGDDLPVRMPLTKLPNK
jgi:hypothetical protein